MGKVVSSHLMEFGYELLTSYPYSYYLHTKGQLDGTISGVDTKPLYFFSPNHTEVNQRRAFKNIITARNNGIPNTVIHRPELDWDVFKTPPLKDYYKSKAITFSKPTVCICNRYTKEWGKDPINFFGLDQLRSMFNLLKDKYQIVYISIAGKPAYYDHSEEEEQGDYEFIYKHFQEVKIIHDISDDYETTFNETVLRVFAGCEKFITMNGGLGILASYFGGENIIYSKECQEIKQDVNSFQRWYYKLGGSFITHVSTSQKLIDMVERRYVNEEPSKTFFIVNTYNYIKTKDIIESIVMSNRYDRVVVYSDSKITSKRLLKYPVIVVDFFTHRNVPVYLSADDIRKHCSNGNYEIISVIDKAQKLRHVKSAPPQKRTIIADDYGFIDILP